MLILTAEGMHMVHHCKYFVAHCMDYRLAKPIRDYLDKEGVLGNCDIVSIAGGVKEMDFLMAQLELSVNLHGTEEAILCNHTDCGAYGGGGQFDSFAQECALHSKELEEAEKTILAKHPSLRVRTMLAEILLSGEVIFKDINV